MAIGGFCYELPPLSASGMHFSVNYPVLCVSCTLFNSMCMCVAQLYFKRESAGTCHGKFWCQFAGELVPSKQSEL